MQKRNNPLAFLPEILAIYATSNDNIRNIIAQFCKGFLERCLFQRKKSLKKSNKKCPNPRISLSQGRELWQSKQNEQFPH